MRTLAVVSIAFTAIFAVSPARATPDKKSEVEVVSLIQREIFMRSGIVMKYEAKIIFADGSRVLASCELDEYSHGGCDLDEGYLDKLKKRLVDRDTIELTGFHKFQAKRNGAELTIYTTKGKKRYSIFDAW